MTIEQATWAALEGVAEAAGVKMSRLAIMAGRDATAFNKDKRADRSPQGHGDDLLRDGTLCHGRPCACRGCGQRHLYSAERAGHDCNRCWR